jgi:hypothetical protein
MKPNPLGSMVGISLLTWTVTVVALGTEAVVEGLLGVAAPLAAAGASWVVAERTHRLRPDRLTSMMVKAFAAKMVFFGVYVIVMLGPLSLGPVPFMTSFTATYIALHVTEAIYLRRLFAA